jgi:alpha-galactosidase
VNRHTRIHCVGLCVGVDGTQRRLCSLVGVSKDRTTLRVGGLNHCHWVVDFRIDGESALHVIEAALDEIAGKPEPMAGLRQRFNLADRRETHWDPEPLCEALFRAVGSYPGPRDHHISEFFPQFIQSTPAQRKRFNYDQAYLRHVRSAHPGMMQKMAAMADYRAPLDEAIFGGQIAWEHTQLLKLLRSEADNLGQIHYVNVPNRGYIHNLPTGAVVEVPALVDAGGLHPLGIGDLPDPILPPLARQASCLVLIIEAAMEGSRAKAVQAFLHDPYCADIDTGTRMVNELIDAHIERLPAFQ